MSTAAPAAPAKVALPPSSLPRQADGGSISSAVGNGDVGHKAAASDGAKTGSTAATAAGGNGSSNGSRPPTASSSTQQQPKKRRVIEDDDDDDDDNDYPPVAPKPRPAPAHSGSGGADGSGSRGAAAVRAAEPSVLNGSSSSHLGDKRKIVAGPPSSAAGKGPSKPVSAGAGAGRKGNDNDDDDTLRESMLKKQPKPSSSGASGSSGSSGGVNNAIPKKIPSKNGVKSQSKSFTIPKREGVSGSPRASSQGAAASSGSKKIIGSSSSSSSSSKPAGMGNRRPASSSSSSARRSYDDDDDFEQKPVKLKKRPEDFTRDPHSKVSMKRKLEEQRAKDEALKKKKRRDSQGSSSSSSKVKADPGRRGSSSSTPTSRGGSGSKPKSVKAKEYAPKKFKEMTRAEKIEQAMKTFKWWEEPDKEDGRQWESLEHNGAHFAPEYKPHGVKLKYDGKDVSLTIPQEEVATFYASMPLDGPQLAEQGTAFNKNFFADFKAMLGKNHPIKDFKLLDFSAMRAHLETAKQIKRAATDGEKAAAKTAKEDLMHKYCYAIVDNHLEKVGNYNVEPPGLFRGRGKHPKTGKLKARVTASDISINCAETVSVPRCTVPGYAWQSVQHDPSVSWLSKWDGVLTGTKYMMLAASSSFKGKSDVRKYDKAMKLKGFIDKIRKDYTTKLSSGDKRTKQIATAVWVIDKLALRVGGEKGADEADTVGCCSLRTEHLTFHKDPSVHEVQMEFLGKDSMLFKETIDFDHYEDIGRRVFKNLQQFCKGKRQSEEVFDYLDPSILNQHLQSLMPGLTAKVFRTYNASDTLQIKLPGEEALAGLSVAEKVALYNGANRDVAILCNHQRTVSSAQKEGLLKSKDQLELLKRQKYELKQMLKIVKTGKGSVTLQSRDKTAEEKAKRAEEKAKKAKANARTDDEKVAATKAYESAMKMKKEAAQSKMETSHLFAKTPSKESVDKRIKTWTEKIKKLEIVIRDKDDNKEVSLTTSKINYMDPRVSVAWCKRHEVPVEKVFAKTLRDKFVWAMNVPPDWTFSYETLLNSKQTTLDVPRLPGGRKKSTAATSSATETSPKAAAATAAKPKPAAVKVEAKPPANPPSQAKGKGKANQKEEEEKGEEAGSSSEEEEEEEESGSECESEEGSSNGGGSGSGSGEEESGSSNSAEEDSSSESGDEDSGDDDDDDDEEEEEEEASSPSKKRRSSGDEGSGGAAKKARRPTIEDDDEEEEEEENDDDDSDFEA